MSIAIYLLSSNLKLLYVGFKTYIYNYIIIKIEYMLAFVKGTENKVIVTSSGKIFRRYPKCKKYLERGYTNFKEVVCKPNNSGYPQVNLGGKINTKTVHRLVAEAFIPNPNNYPEVDHIDGNKLNNDVSNLRWISRKDNCNNVNTVGKGPKKVWTNIVAVNSQTGEKYCFASIQEALENLNIVTKGSDLRIRECIIQNGGYAYGYFWTGEIKPKEYKILTVRRKKYEVGGRIYNNLQELCRGENLEWYPEFCMSSYCRNNVKKFHIEYKVQNRKKISDEVIV